MKRGLLIHGAPELHTCAGGPKRGRAMNDTGLVRGGALTIENGVITDVGTTADIFCRHNPEEYELLDASGSAVLPGFVDAHTHLVFAGTRAEEFSWRLGGESYRSIMERGGGIISTVKATRAATEEALMAQARPFLAEMLAMGVTTLEAKSGYGLDAETELRQLRVLRALNEEGPVELVPTFLGAHSVPPEYAGRADAYIAFLIESVLPRVAAENLAVFCDVFCESGVFSVAQSRRLLAAAKEMGFAVKLHADEMCDLGGTKLAGELAAASADHLLYASDEGLHAMAEAGSVCVLMPLTAFCLREPYARARAMIDMGCTVALGTDFNPGSCFSCSVPLMLALACIQMRMTVPEAVTALTINAAAAIRRAESIGSIEKGKQADVVLLSYPSASFLPYHTGMNLVKTVIKRGVRVR